MRISGFVLPLFAAVGSLSLNACSSDENRSTPEAAGGAGGQDSSLGGAGGVEPTSPEGPWAMGYYASWKATLYPVSEIEWAGLTQIAMSFYLPTSSGTVALMGNNPEVAADLVATARQRGVLSLASIGGADSAPAFRQAMASTRDAFIDSLLALLQEPGYDGLDIDWEPLEPEDWSSLVTIAEQVRSRRPEARLTLPIGCINTNLPQDLSGYRQLAEHYDQLNVMSYGQAGTWEGWNSWHSSALYHQSSATPISIDGTLDAYLAAGVPAEKLGLGIGFYGLCYSEPVREPNQALEGAALLAADSDMSYANIMTSYFDAAARKWDPVARVPYLSFESPTGPLGCTYISYDDPESITEKAAYVRDTGLGGVIMWELNEGYLSDAAPGERSPLLSAVGEQLLR